MTPVLSLMAQPGGTGDPLPCDPEDTSAACQVPLDTWVFALALGALIVTTIYLHRRRNLKLKPVKVKA